MISGYKGHKDIDTTRLKLIRENFSNRKGRQSEVCVVGGWDPDAIVFVGLLDEKRKVSECIVRNPEDSNEVLFMDGDFDHRKDLDMPLDPSKVKKRVKLFSKLPKNYGAFRKH